MLSATWNDRTLKLLMLITFVFGDIVINCSKGKHFILSMLLHIYLYNLGILLKVIGLPQPGKVSVDLQKWSSIYNYRANPLSIPNFASLAVS